MADAAGQTADVARQENINRILDAAERLFRHYGYSKTTVADIARDLGMSSANVYRFFSSKADIHQALAKRMLNASLEGARQIARLPLSASDRLRRFVLEEHRITAETMLDEKKVHEMVVIAIDQQWPVIEDHLERMRGVLAEIIEDGIKSGEFAPQDAALAARCFLASMVILCHPQIIAQCGSGPAPEELIEFALRALAK